MISVLGLASKCGTKGPLKKCQVSDPNPSEHSLSSPSDITGVVPQSHVAPTLKFWAACVTEIFSVCVGGLYGDVSSISGTIKFHHTIPGICIYNGDHDDLSDDKVICIEQDFALERFRLHLSLDLKDPIANLEVSKGEVVWNTDRQRTSERISWLNKHICSVVRGRHGYAAVHYAMFYPAFTATVEVTLSCDASTEPLNVCGVIFAGYGGGHACSTDLEMRYYRSRLFSKPRSKPSVLGSGSRVPLSKSVVAVPDDSSLIIDIVVTTLRKQLCMAM